MRIRLISFCVAVVLISMAATLSRGHLGHAAPSAATEESEGFRNQKGKGKGKAKDTEFVKDRDIFHALLQERGKIRRSVKPLANGVETVTTSTDDGVRDKIREHTHAMHKRIKEGRGIHLRDPLFAEIFRHADKISMEIEHIEQGVRVRETSSVPYVAKLIQAHADVVSQFIQFGHNEVRKNHPIPEK